ncbi:phage integrase SAM-like domain-containing protein [Aestuariivivens sediminis]|uniref:phage integrase SAM-like domain-containing protein n=1 Tax=Aestuariivivens sediminis TaxID=2913557 RepID=UPI001F587FD4|nr:phage integrase SAM-like domain-containing protein [Aestuariivivens sediminis]
MATIKYLLQSKSNHSPIYMRLSISKSKSLKRKTGLFIDHRRWSPSSGLPKQNETSNKALISKLRKLSNVILEKLNDANANGEVVDGNWLVYQIDLYFKRISVNNRSELITDIIQNIVDNAHLRNNAKGGIGLSQSRINSYKRLSELFKEFQGRKHHKVKELNKKVFNEFKKWLMDNQNYSPTYTFKKLSDLKSVCKEARNQGIEISNELDGIKTKQVSAYDDDMDVITLNFEEIEKIEKAKLINEAHVNARKWLILACYTGQRGRDLIDRIRAKNFEKYGEGYIIKIKQQKGNKPVIIPVLPKVKEIYLEGLPYRVSIQKLNKHFKKIGKIAGLNEMVLGRLQDKKTKRGIKKLRPKYKYLSTHIGRRSFASNHYGKIPTPLLMKVTNHKKESTFLSYINQTDDSHIEPFLEFYKSDKDNQHKLKVLKDLKAK